MSFQVRHFTITFKSSERQNIVYGEKVEIALEVPLSMQAELASPLGEMSARNFITSPLWGYELLVREKWR